MTIVSCKCCHKYYSCNAAGELMDLHWCNDSLYREPETATTFEEFAEKQNWRKVKNRWYCPEHIPFTAITKE